MEGRIENLTKELKRRKKEAEQLKKRQEKKKLKLEEEKLRQKLKVYFTLRNKSLFTYELNVAVYSFILDISIAPLQVHYCSEVLPTQHGYCVGVNTPMFNR